jgi:hypothetical protein
VERAFGTLQDRLVKELRLAGISSIEAANAWLPDFLASHNARFGREPPNAKDLHRKLTAADNLDEILGTDADNTGPYRYQWWVLGRVPGSAALRRCRVLRARARGASPFATATGLSPPIRVTPAHALSPCPAVSAPCRITGFM